MKNPYMKFQNPSMHGSEGILHIKQRNGWTDGCKMPQKQYGPPTSSVGGIITTLVRACYETVWNEMKLNETDTIPFLSFFFNPFFVS